LGFVAPDEVGRTSPSITSGIAVEGFKSLAAPMTPTPATRGPSPARQRAQPLKRPLP
jgi:hypothetical protein